MSENFEFQFFIRKCCEGSQKTVASLWSYICFNNRDFISRERPQQSSKTGLAIIRQVSETRGNKLTYFAHFSCRYAPGRARNRQGTCSQNRVEVEAVSERETSVSVTPQRIKYISCAVKWDASTMPMSTKRNRIISYPNTDKEYKANIC